MQELAKRFGVIPDGILIAMKLDPRTAHLPSLTPEETSKANRLLKKAFEESEYDGHDLDPSNDDVVDENDGFDIMAAICVSLWDEVGREEDRRKGQDGWE